MPATFVLLKTDVDNILGRTPDDSVYELTTQDINTRLRLLNMESTTTLTHSASINLPDDFIGAVSVYIDKTPRKVLMPRSPQQFHAHYEDSGEPTYYSIVDDAMLVDGSTTDSIELRYFARYSALSADEDTNAILTTWPAIYIYGALYHHAQQVRDTEAVQSYGAAYESAMRACERQDVRDRNMGQPMMPTRTGATP